MSDITPEQRARALELYRLWYEVRDGVASSIEHPEVLTDSGVRAWLAVEAHVLATHKCPTVPVWRPVSRDEIKPGWEIRSRYHNGTEANWGVAHHQDEDGDWCTDKGRLLTNADAGWTHETTAPEPEPWPDELVDAIAGVMGTTTGGTTWEDDARAVLNYLAKKGLLDRAAITGGEQS